MPSERSTAKSLGVYPLRGRVPWAIVAGSRKTFERVARLPLGGRERARPDGGYVVLVPKQEARGERVSVEASAKAATFDRAIRRAEILASKAEATAFVLGRRAATQGRDEYRPILMAIRGSRVKQSDGVLSRVRKWVSERGLLGKDSDYGGMLGRAVIRLAKTFAGEGHSGMSARLARAYFNWALDSFEGGHTHTMMLNDADFETAKRALKGRRSRSALGGELDPEVEFGLVSESLIVGELDDGVPEQVVEALVLGELAPLDDPEWGTERTAQSEDPLDADIDDRPEAKLIATVNFSGSPRSKYGTHGSKGFKGGAAAYRRAWRLHFSQVGGGRPTAQAAGPVRGTVRRVSMIAATLKSGCSLPSGENASPRTGGDSPLAGSFPETPKDYGLSRWVKPSDDKLTADDIKLTCGDLKIIKAAAVAEVAKRIQMRERRSKS